MKRFIKFKEDFVDKRTLEKYYACMNYIDEFVGERALNQIDEKLALKFSGWLQDNQQLSPRTTKEHLTLLKAAACLWDEEQTGWGKSSDGGGELLQGSTQTNARPVYPRRSSGI